MAKLENETGTTTLSLAADTFKVVLRGHPSGVAIITPDDGSGSVALTATSVASVSADRIGGPAFNGVRAWLRCVVVDRQVDISGHGNALGYHNHPWNRLGDNSKVPV